jgi:cytidylate kinase
MAPTRRLVELVEHQARRWDLEGRRPEPRRPPCIALSRLPGSGAAELGRRVAEKLDFGFFDIELLDQIAREQGIERRLLEGLDEHLRSGIERYVVDAFTRRAFTESEYLRAVVRAITAIGQRGAAVILGRGAPFILSADRALRVLVVASKASRVIRLARDRGVEPATAAAELAREDAARRQFFAHHFGIDPDDPVLYDLVVNTDSLGLDTAAGLVIEALRRRGLSAP